MPSYRGIFIAINKRGKRDFLAPQKIMLPRCINFKKIRFGEIIEIIYPGKTW